MLTVDQEVAGVTAALDGLEARVKEFRSFLADILAGQPLSAELDDLAVSEGELRTVEALIEALAVHATGSIPQAAVWERFAPFSASCPAREGEAWAARTDELMRWTLMWLRKCRTYLAYLAATPNSGDGLRPTDEFRPSTTSDPGFGRYVGRLHLAPTPDGRQMRLVRAFEFEDSQKRWPVPKDAVVDGASIPRALWSLIGGPFEGKYRDASVIHDYYCSVRLAPWLMVHRMFYNGMRASGVSELRAKVMYAGVYYCGPRWSEMDSENSKLPRIDESGTQFRVIQSVFATDVVGTIEVMGNTPFDLLDADSSFGLGEEPATLHIERMERAIETHAPSLDEIETAIDAAIQMANISSLTPRLRTAVFCKPSL